MKLLHLPAYFYPEHAASSYITDNLYQEFCKNDIDIIVFTPRPTRGISYEVYKEFKSKKLEYFYGGRLVVHRFPLYKEGKNSLLRVVRYTLSCIKQFNRGSFAKESRSCNAMFIFSTPPIQGAMASIVKKFNKLPIIYSLQDIFPDSLVSTGLTSKCDILWKFGRIIENFTYRNADKIIVISQDFKRNIMAKGVPEEKIEVIYNWVDENEVVDVSRAKNKLIKKYNLDHTKFFITYCGNIGLTQNMDMLLVVAEELKKEVPDVLFVIVGEGAYKASVEKIIAQKDISNVKLLPFQPYADISHVFSLGDVSLVISKPGVGANSVPSKTWSITSASRPVLASFDENELKDILDGTSKTMIQNGPCGIFTKAGDKGAFKEAILKLYGDRDLCREYGKNGRQFILDNLTREVGTQKYVNVIKGFIIE